jgi:hypothetical protein
MHALSSAFAADAPSQVHVARKDRGPLAMYRAQFHVLEQPHEVRFGGLLKRRDGGRLEPQVLLVILGQLAHKTLEWKFPKQQLGALLVATDLPEGHGPGPEPVGFFQQGSSGGGKGFLGSHGMVMDVRRMLVIVINKAWKKMINYY